MYNTVSISFSFLYNDSSIKDLLLLVLTKSTNFVDIIAIAYFREILEPVLCMGHHHLWVQRGTRFDKNPFNVNDSKSVSRKKLAKTFESMFAECR